MREVAEAAGVSIATVSFVVNNSKRVAPKTRERIERAMAELGFRRNVVARALASRRTRIIALVYPMLAHRLAGAVTEFITSAARAASAASYHLVVWPVGNDGSELVYSYDTQGERTGITALLQDLNRAGIRFRDLQTTQSSLEDIFVGLVRQKK